MKAIYWVEALSETNYVLNWRNAADLILISVDDSRNLNKVDYLSCTRIYRASLQENMWNMLHCINGSIGLH